MAAPDEAPQRALQWMKCFACGKRWDQAGAMLMALNDENEPQYDKTSQPSGYQRKRTADEVMDLVMSGVKAHRDKQDEKEDEMSTCTKKGCVDPAADDSVQCVKHRDQQRAANQAYAGNEAKKEGKAVPTPGKRGPKPKIKASVPAVQSSAPEIHVTVPLVVTGGGVREAIDHLLQQNEQDRAALERVKEMLERR